MLKEIPDSANRVKISDSYKAMTLRRCLQDVGRSREAWMPEAIKCKEDSELSSARCGMIEIHSSWKLLVFQSLKNLDHGHGVFPQLPIIGLDATDN